jgi:uncharacterized protein YciI
VSHFLYKLIPPRPTFDRDMSEAEAAIMGQHVAYWQELVERRTVIVFGPVADRAGAWGLAVVDADSEEDVRALGFGDPAVTSQLARFEVYALPGAIDGRAVRSGPR